MTPAALAARRFSTSTCGPKASVGAVIRLGRAAPSAFQETAPFMSIMPIAAALGRLVECGHKLLGVACKTGCQAQRGQRAADAGPKKQIPIQDDRRVSAWCRLLGHGALQFLAVRPATLGNPSLPDPRRCDGRPLGISMLGCPDSGAQSARQERSPWQRQRLATRRGGGFKSTT